MVMSLSEATRWAVIFPSEDGRVKIRLPYNHYLKMSDRGKVMFKLLAYFDEETRLWLADQEDLKEIIKTLMGEGIQISIVGEAKRIRENIKEKIEKAKKWASYVRKNPEAAVLKTTRISQKDGKNYFDSEGETLQYFDIGKTPAPVLEKSKKVKVYGKGGKAYILFTPTKEALRLLKSKYLAHIKHLAEKEARYYETYAEEQERLLRQARPELKTIN